MPRKPNYGFERAERARAKEFKKAEKMRRQQERGSSQEDNPAAAESEDRDESEAPTV